MFIIKKNGKNEGKYKDIRKITLVYQKGFIK